MKTITRGQQGLERVLELFRQNFDSFFEFSIQFNMAKKIFYELKNALLIALGVLSAGMGLKGFLLSSDFIDGGVTGISMLLAKVTAWPLSVWLPVVNLPFIVIAYRQLGFGFALRSLLAIGTLVLVLVFIPFPDVTPDLLLTAVFGGFFIGAGIGLTIRGGAVLDGTEIAALLISKRVQVLKVGDLILVFNIVIFLMALTVLGVEKVLYSILTYITAAKTLDFIVYGVEEYTALTIVSGQNSKIRQEIINKLGRGVTILKGVGGLSGQDQEVLYCVVTRLEVGQVKKIINAHDEQAFVALNTLVGVEGGVMKKTFLH
ncbi:MAG: YitT family protein [Pseudobdellovibrionaceae bacterium]